MSSSCTTPRPPLRSSVTSSSGSAPRVRAESWSSPVTPVSVDDSPSTPPVACCARATDPGATGLAQVVELTLQLQDRAGPRQVEGARTALAQNGGGKKGNDAAAMLVTVLQA